ncbi:MAG TPA: 16S rRNA (cytosine(967)-C(5))-methyltransferase RsmB [Candidatus Acidoferrales bacterium]
MPISPARLIAFDVLRRVEADGAYASDALHAELNAGVEPADAALATELTMAVLRWRRLLDFLLGRASKKPIARLDLPVAVALRIGLYQLRFMHRIPAHAAVHESVELVKRARKASAATFVNAILRKLSEANQPAEEFLPADLPLAEQLAILHSHPTWLVERWLARLGESETIALLCANNQTPRLSCGVTDPRERARIFEELAQGHLVLEPGRVLQNAFSVTGGSVSRTTAFREGRISIQDEASQAVPLLLGIRRGDRVLDLCAAPGGKTTILARAAGADSFVLAADLYAHRLRAAKAQFARLHLDNIGLVAIDAAKLLPFRESFQRILVDAPCSGTGTLARHPEIRWRLEAVQLKESHRLQVAILHNAIALAPSGGSILYSTCSLEPEENEQVIEAVLNDSGRGSARISRASKAQLAALLQSHLADGLDAARFFDERGAFRTSPSRDGTDGFFAAVLVKEG